MKIKKTSNKDIYSSNFLLANDLIRGIMGIILSNFFITILIRNELLRHFTSYYSKILWNT